MRRPSKFVSEKPRAVTSVPTVGGSVFSPAIRAFQTAKRSKLITLSWQYMDHFLVY